MSRTSSIGTTRIEVAIALIAAGFSRRRAAAYIGVAESTLRCALASDPVLAERVAQAQIALEKEALYYIRASMSRSWRAAAWVAEHTNRHDYCRTKGAELPAIPDDDDQKYVAKMHDSHVLSAEQAKRQIEELDQHRPLTEDATAVALERPETTDTSEPNPKTPAGVPPQRRLPEGAHVSVAHPNQPHVVAGLPTERPAPPTNANPRTATPHRQPHAIPSVQTAPWADIFPDIPLPSAIFADPLTLKRATE